MELKAELRPAKMKQVSPPLPPPLPPLPRFWAVKKTAPKAMMTESVTNQEIAKFWRQKQMEEEDHLLAAIKAAARIRAQNLTKDEYQQYEESLMVVEGEDYDALTVEDNNNGEEIRVGIKDWWRKSKYAYLNQPATGSMDTAKRSGGGGSSYIPNFCSCKLTPLQPAALGVF